jgi:two-component system sensor histidine kinase BaeS
MSRILIVEDEVALNELIARQLRQDGQEVVQAFDGDQGLAAVESGDLTCTVDRLRFEQALLNLVRNAIHYTTEGGVIMVTSGPSARGHVRLAVQDSGIGIPTADLPHVSDRFFRADRSYSRTGGSAGLGLAIARENVAAMGGSITVASVEDDGTTFTIELAAAAQRSAASPVSEGAVSPA